jgi:hypothetical protein
MALYQFQFYQFNQLTLTEGSPGNGGAGPEIDDTGNTTGANVVGESFSLNTGGAVTTVIVDDDDPFADDTSFGEGGTTVAVLQPGSFGAGLRLELEFTMTVSTNEVPPRVLQFYAISTSPVGGGTPTIVGIVGDEIMRPGVTYTVTAVGDNSVGVVPWQSLACFTYGTMIDTADGARLIEELSEGDLVATLDHGSQVVRWIGTRHISQIDMMANPALRPVLFDEGTIGNTRPLLVSPQHRILLSDWRAQVFFGEDQVLVPAKAMVNGTTIRQTMPAEGVTYCHLLFDQHEILVTEGALTESFHPSDESLDMLTEDQQRELDLIFPELIAGSVARQTAYPVVRVQDAKSLRISA